MKKFFIFLSFWVFVLTLSAKLTTASKGLSVEYVVQNGDTLYVIAQKHHTTVGDVLKANHLGYQAVIKVGQKLTVPLNTYFPTTKPKQTDAAPAPAPKKKPVGSKTVSYTVQNGDTLFTIARAHHTSIRAVLEANHMERDIVIKVGQNLSVPTNNYFPDVSGAPSADLPTQRHPTASKKPSAPSSTETYTVTAGDTLFSVARKNHIVISKLMQYNHIGLGDTLRVGQILKISSSATFITSEGLKGSSSKKETHKRTLPIGAMPSYTVKKGDTLWGIAHKHHLTLTEIRTLNKMKKNDRIHAGTILAVGKAVRPKPKTYRVKKGDTLWLIAKKNNMNTRQLRRLNHMRRKDRIHTGMILALSKDATSRQDRKTNLMIEKLKKKGAKQSEIDAVLARVKRSKKHHPNITEILAQVKREKRNKQIKTPLRVTKKGKKHHARTSLAASLLNGHSSRSSRWSGNSKTIRIAKRYLGHRYVWGAVGPRSFDCSGFTQYVMRKSKGVRLPRISRKQAYYGRYVSRSHLRSGDLIFFDTSRRRRGYVNHVGIYIGNNKFIHASSARHRVVITSLNRPFYSARFKWGRRVN